MTLVHLVTVLLLLAALAPATSLQVPPPSPGASTDSATVVLLHGLGRTPRSMAPMEEALKEQGYRVVNLGYPSREHAIESLVDTLASALDACCEGPVHFVTHSLGGILVRAYAATNGTDRIGRVVMLSPPNAGSEIVDRLDGLAPVAWLLGPAFLQLSTDTAGVPSALGPPPFEVGVITGEASLNPLFSWWLPGEDDGKVSVESARLEGAEDFLVVPYSHAFIMRKDDVILQVVEFLRTGRFLDTAAPGQPVRPGEPDSTGGDLAAGGSPTTTSFHVH